jgi:C-terminal processing protease CtpA/Prc
MAGGHYDVLAPSGKLHIILKTDEEDGIVIEMISEASPLAGKVSVGDILVSVDEIDVREQTAAMVNRTIDHRKNSLVRKLVFIKGNGYCPETDVDEGIRRSNY